MSAVRAIFPVKEPYTVRHQSDGIKPASHSPVIYRKRSRSVSGAVGRGGPGVPAQSAGYLDTVGEQTRIKTLQAARTKVKMQVFHALKACGRDKEALNLLGCGLWFRVFESKCGTKRVLPCCCDHALCPDCSRERSFPLQRKIFALTRNVEKSYRFITFTLKNSPSIDSKYVRSLSKMLAKVRRLDMWKRWITGGVYAVDTTYNREKRTWHVHLHAIVEVSYPEGVKAIPGEKPWLPQQWIFELQKEWLRITGNSHVVHMRAVNRNAVKELVKYQAKAANFAFSGPLVDEYLKAFHKSRRIQTFGSFQSKAEEETVEEVQKGQMAFWKCACGGCFGKDWKRNKCLLHLKDTMLDGVGYRIVKPDLSPPNPISDSEFFLTEKEYYRTAQRRLSFEEFINVLSVPVNQFLLFQN